MITIQVFSDNGHGWAKIKRSYLAELDILNKISSYSYQRGSFVYLEEDCDLSLFCDALKQRGIEYRFKTTSSNRRSRIRGYNRFTFSADDTPF